MTNITVNNKLHYFIKTLNGPVIDYTLDKTSSVQLVLHLKIY